MERAKALRVNAGVEAGTDVGPVISRDSLARIHRLVESGVQEGARLVLDGRWVQVGAHRAWPGLCPMLFPPPALQALLAMPLVSCFVLLVSCTDWHATQALLL